MRQTTILSSALAMVSLVIIGCGGPETATDEEGVWVGTIETEGDVTTVVNESGSVWGGTATLVEEASIGVEAGADECMLGLVGSVYATDDRIYVADPQVPAVRMYDLDGTYVGDLGAQGQGPGEYVRPMIVGSLEDGRIFVFDRGAMRYNIHSPGGSPSTPGPPWTPTVATSGSSAAPGTRSGASSGTPTTTAAGSARASRPTVPRVTTVLHAGPTRCRSHP